MKTWIYAKRNLIELINDPLSLIFTIVLPAFLLVFMVSLNKSLGINESFIIENFLPAMIIFSFSFLTLFSGILISKDRTSSFLSRMFVSPMKPIHYILGYMIPMFFIAMVQALILYGIGIIMGLPLTIHLIASIPFLLLVSLLFISMGILFGSLFKDQQVGPIASIMVQIVAFMSGMWFRLDLVGGAYETIGISLPFYHGVHLIQSILAGNYSEIVLSLLIVIGYILLVTIFSVIAFKRKMKA